MLRRSLEKYVCTFVGCPDLQYTWLNIIYLWQELPVELEALINDTTGTLIASHYVDPRTKIACIFGTGCNAAYMENVSDIPKIAGYNMDGNTKMVINCEWVRSSYSTFRPKVYTYIV